MPPTQFAVMLHVRHPEDVPALQEMLRDDHLLIPGNYTTPDPCDIASYLFMAQVQGREFRTLLDRNLVSPLVQLARGNSLPADSGSALTYRLSAACLAFCTLSDILVEPSMALYEYASSTSHADAESDHRYFRIADNVDPIHYIDIALGRTDRLPSDHLIDLYADQEIASQTLRETNLQKTLHLWKPQYLCVLKTAELLRSGVTGRSAAEALLRWQAEESFFNAPALLFCVTALSHRPPRGGMIKDVHTQSAVALRKGVCNATWDICLISQWGKSAHDGNPVSWALSSNDIALRSVANALFIGPDESSEARLLEYLRSHWSNRDGEALFNAYWKYSAEARHGTPERSAATRQAFSKIDESISHLEKQIGIPSATSQVSQLK